MPLCYEVDGDKRQVLIAGNGRLTMEGMLAIVDTVAEDPRFSSGYSVILDLRNADYTAELSDGDAFVATIRRRQDNFRNRFALLVPEHLHFLARMFSLLAVASGYDRMKCFTDAEEARAWCQAGAPPQDDKRPAP